MNFLCKKITLYLIIIMLGGILGSCNTQKNKNTKPTISVSILPEKYFVEQICGNDFNINVAIAPGASHANYDPSPSEMTALHQSVAYFKIGQVGFEYATLPRLYASNSTIKIFDLSEGINFMGFDKNHCCEHHGVDPHIWLSPKLVKTIAQNIYHAVVILNPQKVDVYKRNLQTFQTRIDSLNRSIAEQLLPFQHRSFMIYHPSLTYYAKDYNLEQIAIEMEGKEPTAAWMQHLSEQIQEKNIKLIFIQSEYDISHAKAISESTGAKVVSINPMAEDWMQELNAITKFLSENL